VNLLLLVFNGSVIAAIYTLAKLAGQAGVSALGVLAFQLLVAAVLVSAVAAVAGRLPRWDGRTLRYAVVAGALGIAAPNLITFAALGHLPAGLVGVIGALSPVFTYGLALLLRVERVQPLRAAGVVLGGVGVLVLLLPRSALPEAALLPWALLALAGPLLLAGGNLFRSLAWPPGLHPLSAASALLVTQALLFVPAAALLGELWLPGPALQAPDLALAGAGLLTTAFYLTAFELQRRAGPVVVGQLGYVITVVSLLLGAWVFGEKPAAATVWAVLLVFGGVLLVQRGAPAKGAP
jgi:drug/metabolite transporter (DMT)-like permease